MPNIEHIAIWTTNLERSRSFYETYFGAAAGKRYHNPEKGFTSYFLKFETGARLELMHNPSIKDSKERMSEPYSGYAHMAVSVGSREAVDKLTERLRNDHFKIAGEPRRTGDGYYESVVLDPDGNRIEITI